MYYQCCEWDKQVFFLSSLSMSFAANVCCLFYLLCNNFVLPFLLSHNAIALKLNRNFPNSFLPFHEAIFQAYEKKYKQNKCRPPWQLIEYNVTIKSSNHTDNFEWTFFRRFYWTNWTQTVCCSVCSVAHDNLYIYIHTYTAATITTTKNASL